MSSKIMPQIYCAFDEIADTDSLVSNPRNPNTHPPRQITLLAKIIKTQGWRAPITVSNRSGFIVRGHGRLMAAKELGLEQVPIDRQDYQSEAAEWADLIADNRIAELAEIDAPTLKELLAELDASGIDLELTGFAEGDLSEMLAPCLEAIEEDDFDVDVEADEVREPVTKSGDIWALGPHRLMCGDATKREDVEKLMAGSQADSLVTDPPYGVNYAAKNEFLNKADRGNRNQTPITADEGKDYRQFFGKFLALAPLANKNTVYTFISGKELHSLRLALEDQGFKCASYLVWVKNHFVLGRKDYHAKHEFILYGWNGSHKFYGDTSASTVLEFDKPHKSEHHPTMKPVALIARLISDGTVAKGKVYDPFLGSGTTLIACEQLGRTCFGLEVEPVYCDVIIKRWEELTGKKAVLL